MQTPIAPSADAAAAPAPASAGVAPPPAVDYPSSDGKPLAENDPQLHAILYAVGALRVYYGHRPDVYVSGDLLVYYEEGNPRVSVAPDAFVVFGVEDRRRMNYKVWEEGKGPDFVLEVASPSTWREDVRKKPAIYAGLGVREYFLFDPMGAHYTPRLQGYRMVGGAYERLTAVASIDRTLALHSEVLGLDLRTRGEEIRFHDPATGETLLSHSEMATAHRDAEARAAATEARATDAEALAAAAEVRATDAEARAAATEARAAAAEARVAELESKLGEKGH